MKGSNMLSKKFKSNDFCLNGKNCKEVQHNRYRIYYEIDCKCPAEKSFKCGKYCATNSIACGFIESNKIENKNIADCGNQNKTFDKYNYGKF